MSIIQGPTSVKISAGVASLAYPVEVACGVPLVDIPAGNSTNQYFWAQKTGLASVLFGTDVGAVGGAVYHGEDAGSFQSPLIEVDDATDVDQKVHLGTTYSLLPFEAEYFVVNLQIA